MLFFVIAIIALGWAVFGLSWSRERMNAKARYGLPPSPYVTRTGPLSPPRTAAMAQMRRQQVLAALVVAAVGTYFLTRLWSVMWGLHILVDVALVGYGIALYMRSQNPQVFNQLASANFPGTSVLSANPRTASARVAERREEKSLIEMPERRFPSLSGSGRFAPVLEDERTAVRPGPQR